MLAVDPGLAGGGLPETGSEEASYEKVRQGARKRKKLLTE
jgi:hypothetical protein